MKKKANEDGEKLILINAVEELVKQSVEQEIKKMNMCQCEKCKLNACAIALNALPPQYVTTTRGRLFTESEELSIDFRANMMVEVTKALLIVKEHPMHKISGK